MLKIAKFHTAKYTISFLIIIQIPAQNALILTTMMALTACPAMNSEEQTVWKDAEHVLTNQLTSNALHA